MVRHVSPSFTPDKLRLARRIRSARTGAGLSQERLADAIGTSRRHVIRWENAEHRPSPTYIARIAEATGEAVDFFDDDEDDEEAAVSLLGALRFEIRRMVREEARA